MDHETGAAQRPLQLPVMVSSPADVGRLLRELEVVDDNLLQLKLRKAGDELKLPKTSYLLDQLVELNKLNLLHDSDRQRAQSFLQLVKQKAPVLHISFGADPSASFLEKLMVWLRQEIHQHILVTIGLQPTIGAGCVVRTTNHQFDFSLRQNIVKSRDLLISHLIAVNQEAQA